MSNQNQPMSNQNQPMTSHQSSGDSVMADITGMQQRIELLANMLRAAENERRIAEEHHRSAEEEWTNDRRYLVEMAQQALSESRQATQVVLETIGVNDDDASNNVILETPLTESHGLPKTPLTETINSTDSNHGIKYDSIKDAKVRLPEFDGEKQDYDQWYDVCLTRLEMYNLREADKVKMINSCLVGNARKYLLNKGVTSVQTLSEFDNILRPCFSDRINWHSLWADLVQGPEEKVQNFAVRIRIAAAGCCFGDGTDKQCVQLLRKKAAPEIQRALLGLGTRKTFDECVEHAIEYERSIVELEKMEKRAPKRRIDNINEISEYSKEWKQALENQKRDIMASNKSLSEKVLNIQTALNNQDKRSGNGFKRTRKVPICYVCKCPGHVFSKCATATAAEKSLVEQQLRDKTFRFPTLPPNPLNSAGAMASSTQPS
jgi:hypothetical protein